MKKNPLQLARLYNATCNILLDYIEYSDEISENIIFDLIDFDKDSIYKDANDNNLELILNLKKNHIYILISSNLILLLIYPKHYLIKIINM